MNPRSAPLTATFGAAVLVLSGGSALAADSGGGPGALVYHCDAVTGGAVHGSASVKLVNGSPDPSTDHGDPACVIEVVSIITGGFSRDRATLGRPASILGPVSA
jgi:hypothetical protein